MLNGETTVKSLKLEDRRIELFPENDLRIMSKVIGFRRT
jgi:hypothetical protein